MRDTFPPAAGALIGACGLLDPKLIGGRPLPRRRVGDGDVGGEKYSSLELDATAATSGLDPLDDPCCCEAELSDDSGDVASVLVNLARDLVCIICLNIHFVKQFYI